MSSLSRDDKSGTVGASLMGDVPAAEIIQRDFKDSELPQPSANAHRQSQPIDPSAMVNQSKEAT
jgi:hypothetical protein